MPRIARGLFGGFVYHILNRGNGGQKVFHKDKDYEAFVSLIRDAKERFPLKIFAYCLMPTHFHMVVMHPQADYLSKWMQWLMTSHVRRYHQHYGTTGYIWQGRFKSFIVQADNYLLTVLRYVEGNPVRAQLVSSAKDWLWSSHRERIGQKPALLVSEPPIALPEQWDKFVDQPFTEKDLAELRKSISRQAPYGARLWQVKICKELGLESTMRAKGRPRVTEK
jgi:putative transposase